MSLIFMCVNIYELSNAFYYSYPIAIVSFIIKHYVRFISFQMIDMKKIELIETINSIFLFHMEFNYY